MIREKAFRWILKFSGLIIAVILLLLFLTLLYKSVPSIRHSGFSFLFSGIWDPVNDEYGAVPFLAGTLITSFLALFISIPFAISLAVLLGEYIKTGFLSSALKTIIELLAGIPSVIYGFWGLFVLVPLIQKLQLKLGVIPYGVGMLTSAIILSIMIIPYSASISKEVINMVPRDLKEAAYSLGATRYEVIKKVSLPYAKSGIFAGILLSLGRALGETMAVTMVIGNRNTIPKSIFDPANTMASIIANEFAEASSNLYHSTLIEIALVLLFVTAVISFLGKIIMKRLQRGMPQ